MPEHSGTMTAKIAQFVGPAEADEIGRQNMKISRKRVDIEFPAHFRAGAKLAGMQQDKMRSRPGFDVMGSNPVNHHVIALHRCPTFTSKIRLAS
jgi:hypothetical protein